LAQQALRIKASLEEMVFPAVLVMEVVVVVALEVQANRLPPLERVEMVELEDLAQSRELR
jgi:hypothetical protein